MSTENTYLERMRNENSELCERIVKLRAFISQNSLFRGFTEKKKGLMEGQLKAMGLYQYFLSQRIEMEQKDINKL